MMEQPFVALNAIETLQRSISLYLQSGTVRLFIKLALFFVIPATAVLLTIIYTLLHHHSANGGSNSNNDDSLWHNFWRYVTILMSQSLLQTTFGAIAEGAIAVAVADLYLRRTPQWSHCLQKALTKVTTLLLSGLVAGICILLGYWCFYIPGLILKLNFLVVTPVIILEDELSALSALGRSWDLVKEHRIYVLKCLVGLDVLYWTTNWILRSLLKEDAQHHPFFSLTFHLIQMIPSTMITPLFGILKTVVYINLMVLQENMNEERFGQQVDQGFVASREPLLSSSGSDDVEVCFEDAQEAIPELNTLHSGGGSSFAESMSATGTTTSSQD